MPDIRSSGRTSTHVITPDIWAVYVLHETRDGEGKKVVHVWRTDVVGSFSDCSRDKRRVVLPAGKGYRSVLVRRGVSIFSDWGYTVAQQDTWTNPTT